MNLILYFGSFFTEGAVSLALHILCYEDSEGSRAAASIGRQSPVEWGKIMFVRWTADNIQRQRIIKNIRDQYKTKIRHTTEHLLAGFSN